MSRHDSDGAADATPMTGIRVNFRIKTFNGDTPIKNTYSSSRRRILNRSRALPWETAFLRATYYNGQDKIGVNEGWFSSQEDFEDALYAFSEPGLLDYLEEGEA